MSTLLSRNLVQLALSLRIKKKKKYLALSLTLKIFLSNTLNGSHPHLSTPLYTYLSCLNVGLLIINCEGDFLLKLNLDSCICSRVGFGVACGAKTVNALL